MRHHFQLSALVLLLGLCLGFVACRSTVGDGSGPETASKVTAGEPLVRYYVVADA